MSKPLLEVRHLKKYFQTPQGLLHAVDDLSFEIPKGSTLGVVGESGCGKSTLGRTLLRLLEPTDGEIFYEGMDIARLNKHEMRQMRRRMQIIFQDPYASLNPRKSIAQIIEAPLLVHKLYSTRAEREARVKALLNLTGLSTRLTHAYPHELDGGRRQRVVIARALALDPDFIVCDEPVSALDVSIQAQILNLLQDLQEEMGLTYLFITHDLSVVKHFADQIAVMYLGQIIEQGEKERLFSDPQHPYTRALLSAIPKPIVGKKVERILLTGEICSPIAPRPSCRFHSRCPFKMERCAKETPPLKLLPSGQHLACFLAENEYPHDEQRRTS